MLKKEAVTRKFYTGYVMMGLTKQRYFILFVMVIISIIFFLLSTYSNFKRLSSLLMTFILFTFDILTHAFHSFIHPYPTHIISVYGLLLKKTNDETFLIAILYIEYHHMTK